MEIVMEIIVQLISMKKGIFWKTTHAIHESKTYFKEVRQRKIRWWSLRKLEKILRGLAHFFSYSVLPIILILLWWIGCRDANLWSQPKIGQNLKMRNKNFPCQFFFPRSLFWQAWYFCKAKLDIIWMSGRSG